MITSSTTKLMLSLRIPKRTALSQAGKFSRPCERHSYAQNYRPPQSRRPPPPPRQAYRDTTSADEGPDVFAYARFNKFFMRTCYAISIGVFGAWSFSDNGLAYKMYDKLQMDHGAAIQSATGIKLPRAPSTTTLSKRLREYFLLKSGEPYNVVSWFGSALSHRDPVHFLFNMFTWSSFAPMLFYLPPVHVLGVTLGSAAASAASWLYAERGKPYREQRNAMGASGIVSGILTVVTMFMPLGTATLFFVIPAPLFVITGGYFLAEAYFLQADKATGYGHAAHLGGGAFGALYYAFFLRRFGGILGR